MKLLGTNFDATDLIAHIEARLRARGLLAAPRTPMSSISVEPPVEPLSFNLQALEEHADPTRPLPLSTHRGGLGRLVLAAKWTFRKTCQVFINEALARQRVFNGHVRDSYAQLSAEVLRLQQEVQKLRAKPASPRRSSSSNKRSS